MIFLETILDELLKIFKKNGVNAYSDAELIRLLDIRQTTFDELFPSKEEMVKKVVWYDSELQKREHVQLLASAQSPVEEIILLLKHGIKNLESIGPKYVQDLMKDYPEAWKISLDHLNTYSYHQLYDIINKGILDGLFRKDINIQLVVKIILEQIFMILNPAAFPPEKFELSEVFRSIFLYYIRGLCTERGSKIAEDVFSRNNL